MNALLLRLGVDPVQWRVLLKASLRMDFPVAVKSEAKPDARRKPPGRGMIVFLVVFYVVAGVTPATVAYFSPDVLLGATSLAATVAFLVASMLLMGEGTNIVSPGDHLILGFRPVTSRTYLAVRVSALLVRTVVVSGAVSLIPAIVFLTRRGTHPGRALGALVTGELTGIAATLAIVAMYGWVLKKAGPARTLRLASYVQLAANMLVWGGFMLATQVLNERVLAGLSLSETSWWLALPASWFGTWVMLGAGQAGWMPIVGALLSLVTVAGLVQLIGDKLSMGYTEHLSKLASATEVATPQRRDWFTALNDETRAIAILVRSHLEHDMKFRLGLISLIPVTVIYMIAGGMPADPFVRGQRGGGNPGMIQMALIFIPMSLRQAIVNSESYRASWIFHAAPADRGRLVLSSRNIITAFFLLPYLACLAAIFAYAFGDAVHALLHAAFLGLISWIVLQFLIMVRPQLPFSMPLGKDSQGAFMIVHMFVAMTIGLASYFALVAFVYRAPIRMIIAAVVFVGVGMSMDRVTRARVRRRRVEEIHAE